MQAEEDFDHILFRGGVVTAGSFRLAADHPDFEDAGPIHGPVLVFPRTSCVIEQEGRPPFVTDTNSVVYYNRGQPYRRRPHDPRGDFCDWFRVREKVLRDLLVRHDPAAAERPGQVFPFGLGPSDTKSFLLQRAIIRHLQESGEPEGLLVEEVVLAIVDRVARAAPWPNRVGASSDSGATAPMVADLVRAILRDTYRETSTLEEIARRAGVSPFHMCRQFRTATGTTIHRYRTQLRMRRALELVADGDADLTDVALHLGYSSHSHFTATFRGTFGTTPSEFRSRMSRRRVERMARRLEATATAGIR